MFWYAASVSYASYWYAKLDDPCSIADKLPNGYQSLLVVVIVVAVMPNDYHMVVVAAVMAMMTIGLRKSAGCKEHEPVSYTHLDVYKRQPLHSATRSADCCRWTRIPIISHALLRPA